MDRVVYSSYCFLRTAKHGFVLSDCHRFLLRRAPKGPGYGLVFIFEEGVNRFSDSILNVAGYLSADLADQLIGIDFVGISAVPELSEGIYEAVYFVFGLISFAVSS
jgi:hypothetical protein